MQAKKKKKRDDGNWKKSKKRSKRKRKDTNATGTEEQIKPVTKEKEKATIERKGKVDEAREKKNTSL